VVSESNKHGQWVFRNNRWFFLSKEATYFDYEPTSVDREALASLVDPSELIQPLRILGSVSGLPVLVFFVDERTDLTEWERTNPEVLIGSPEELTPGWCQEVDSISPELAQQCRDAMTAAAQRAVLRGTPVLLDSPLLEGSIRAEPIGFVHQGKPLNHGAVTVMALGSEQLPGARALSASAGIPVEQAEAALAAFGRVLPSKEDAARYANLVALQVHTYTARVQESFVHRVELASEQSRSHHHLLRAEHLEKRLRESTAETDRAEEGTGGVMKELEVLLEMPDLGITIEDTNHVVRYVNPMMRKVFGNVVGRKCHESFRGRSSPCEPCVLEQIWGEGKGHVTYRTPNAKTGQEFLVMAVPLVSGLGEKLVLEVGFDVTETAETRRGLESKLKDTVRRSEQLETAREIAGRVLVDSCEKIGRILMQVSIAHEKLAASGDKAAGGFLERYGERLATSGAQLSRIVAGMTEIGMSLGPITTACEVDVETLARRLVDDLAADRPNESIRCSIAVMPQIRTDPSLLERLLSHLIRNALEHNPSARREIDISHTMSGEPDAIVPGDAYHVISVADNGPSIPDELTEQVWSPFEKGPGAREQAAGVGLTAAHLISLNLDCKLWLERNRWGGTTAFLSLPSLVGQTVD